MSSHTQLEMRIVIKMSWGKSQPCRKQYFKCGPECPVVMGSLWGIQLLIINKFPLWWALSGESSFSLLTNFQSMARFSHLYPLSLSSVFRMSFCLPTISLSALNFLNLLDIFKVNLAFSLASPALLNTPTTTLAGFSDICVWGTGSQSWE